MTTQLSKIMRASVVLAVMLIGLASTATTVAGDYSISIVDRGVAVRISGDLLQGVPDPPSINTSDTFGKIPIFNLNLVNQNVSSLSDLITNAIREKSPTASIDSVALVASSNGSAYHYDLAFDVSGISSRRLDAVALDLSWRSFVTDNDFRVGNYSVNNVVLTYLQASILTLAQQTSSPPNQPGIQHLFRWWWNGHIVDQRSVGALSAAASMLNFTSLQVPLEKWTETPNFDAGMVTFEARSGFNLTFADQIKELSETGVLWTNAIYKLKAIFNAPWGATAAGNNLLFFESTVPWTVWLMLTSILAIGAVLVSTTLLEKRLKGAREQPRRKK